jgi:ubiquinone/menaquinone biosynthesis C-methylase UbiE
MPDVEHEKHEYDASYQWPEGGHEWSRAWGSASEQWVATIYRRIFHLLPTKSILEIAPGFGRWTPYLLNNCSTYYGVDIADRCIAHCRRTYGPLAMRPTFLLGDGLTLAGVPDNSISLVFSFDSLVHVDLECLAAYAGEIHRVLEPGGNAFVHHANLAEYSQDGALRVANPHRRDTTVSAELAASVFHRVGLVSLVHEKVQWIGSNADTDPFCDCFSLITKPPIGAIPSLDGPAAPIFYNRGFLGEIAECRAIGQRYRPADTSR